MDAKRPTPRPIIIKMSKIKDNKRILKAAKEALQAGRDWQEKFKVRKSRNLQPRLLYPAKLSFRIEGQIKCFPDNVKLKFIINKPLLHEMLKVCLLYTSDAADELMRV